MSRYLCTSFLLFLLFLQSSCTNECATGSWGIDQKAVTQIPELEAAIKVLSPYKQLIVDSVERYDTANPADQQDGTGFYGLHKDGSYTLYSPYQRELEKWIRPLLKPDEWRAVEQAYESGFSQLSFDARNESFSFPLHRKTCGDSTYWHTLNWTTNAEPEKSELAKGIPMKQTEVAKNWMYTIWAEKN